MIDTFSVEWWVALGPKGHEVEILTNLGQMMEGALEYALGEIPPNYPMPTTIAVGECERGNVPHALVWLWVTHAYACWDDEPW